MRNKNTRKGFTTVELVIVIAVIAILATVLVPTFSNMINQANLSADKQNVRNMNMVLLTYMIEGTEDFGDVRKQLLDGGYKTGEKFAPNTKGYRYLWYAEKNVILLVNADGEVEYPEEYVGLEERPYDVNKTPNNPDDDIVYNVIEDIRLCFDLSLPAARIAKDFAPESISVESLGNLDLAIKYIFTANEDEGIEYDDWLADFYISIDLPENVQKADLVLAGFHKGHGKWEVIPMVDFNEDRNEAILGNNFDYKTIRTAIKEFQCGIVDTKNIDRNTLDAIFSGYDDPSGAKLHVELRLTESYLDESDGVRKPVENGEQKVLGVFTYTFN